MRENKDYKRLDFKKKKRGRREKQELLPIMLKLKPKTKEDMMKQRNSDLKLN